MELTAEEKEIVAKVCNQFQTILQNWIPFTYEDMVQNFDIVEVREGTMNIDQKTGQSTETTWETKTYMVIPTGEPDEDGIVIGRFIPLDSGRPESDSSRESDARAIASAVEAGMKSK